MPLDDPEGFPVGQRERLTVRLKSLIRQYQRGPGIIKEFIQNADDAGSNWVRVVMDWRDHRTGAPEEESLADILGPALLIANGSVFSEPIRKGIESVELVVIRLPARSIRGGRRWRGRQSIGERRTGGVCLVAEA